MPESFPGLPQFVDAASERRKVDPHARALAGRSPIVNEAGNAIARASDTRHLDDKRDALAYAAQLINGQAAALEATLEAARSVAKAYGLHAGALDSIASSVCRHLSTPAAHRKPAKPAADEPPRP